MHILKKPDLTDPNLRAKLAKGMGHNYYGEPAWPNDLLYMFPVVILGTIGCMVGLAVLDPAMLGDKADPFATPLEILPEWYLYPVFQILRVVPNKLLGIALQTMVPLGLIWEDWMWVTSKKPAKSMADVFLGLEGGNKSSLNINPGCPNNEFWNLFMYF